MKIGNKIRLFLLIIKKKLIKFFNLLTKKLNKNINNNIDLLLMINKIRILIIIKI